MGKNPSANRDGNIFHAIISDTHNVMHACIALGKKTYNREIGRTPFTVEMYHDYTVRILSKSVFGTFDMFLEL